MIHESNLTGANPDNKAPADAAPPAKPKSAGAALQTSSYLYDRYFKMTFK